jgi:hypothetical protein
MDHRYIDAARSYLEFSVDHDPHPLGKELRENDPIHWPEKILASHLCDHLTDLNKDPRTPILPSDHLIDTSKALTSRSGVNARRSQSGRSPSFRAIAATSVRTRSKAADQNDEATAPVPTSLSTAI